MFLKCMMRAYLFCVYNKRMRIEISLVLRGLYIKNMYTLTKKSG